MGSSFRILLVWALLGVNTASAVDPERHITELVHRVWDSKSGVPADILSLTQTRDGFLWVGSLRGLYRFDGVQFRRFEPHLGEQLPSQEIRSVFGASRDRLWIGYRAGGASVLEGGRLINYGAGDGFPEGSVRGFAEDRQGRIWAVSSGGLACFEGKRWRRIGSESGFPGNAPRAILIDHLGSLWVAGEHRIAVLGLGASKFDLTDEPYDGQVSALAESPEGTVWMAETTRAVRPVRRPDETGFEQGLTRDDCQKRFPDSWKTEPRCRRANDLEVRVGSLAILFDQNGGFWITTLGDGLRRAPVPSGLPKTPLGEFDDALEQFTNKDGLSSDVVNAILEDREGNIWVATPDGIDQFRNGALALVRLGSTVGEMSIVPDNDGYVVARDTTHLFRFHDAHSRVETAGAYADLRWLYRDPFGSIWGTGFDGGCQLLKDRCVTHLPVPAKAASWDLAWRLAMDGKHRIWAYVAKEGLFALEDGNWRPVAGLLDGPSNTVPSTQYTDGSGHVWFGFQDGRILTVTEGGVRTFSARDGLALGEIKAIGEIEQHVWVGGSGGVAVLRGAGFSAVRPSDVAAFASVSGIVADDEGGLWLNESRGVIRVAPSEVSAVLRDSSHRTHYELLDSLDGFSGATEQFVSPSAIRGTDGRLWFATTHGAVWIDPRRIHHYQNKVPPPVSIQSVVADGQTLPWSERLELSGRTTDVQIAYAGLSLSVPERVQFRYRLGGLEREWQSAGARRTAYYSRLPPGSYDFQVIASNDGGVWNTVGAHLPIRVAPKWYQTLWFRALTCVVLAFVLGALYRLRMAQVRAETHRLVEARLSERERIARELHDTLLQRVHGLLLQLQTAYKLLPTRPDKAKGTLETAINGAFDAASEGRNAVQGLRASTATDNDLGAMIKSLGEEIAERQTERVAVLRVEITGTPKVLIPQVRDEACRIAGELLRNAFRHAEATGIEVDLCYDDRELRLRVRDDGKGIDASFLGESSPVGHYGIRGMRERAQLIGASFTVWTAPDSGTEIELNIPAASAYAESPSPHPWWSFRRATVRHVPSEY